MSIKTSAYISIIPIDTVLLFVNQNGNIVWFTDEKLPHLGLHYSKSASFQEILEAKNLLAWLAGKNLKEISAIEADFLAMKDIF